MESTAFPIAAYAVIGHPISHSRSPWIHTHFAKQTKQNLVYTAELAPLDGFRETVDAFQARGGLGLNVTVPFKNEAFALATQYSQRAQEAEAVNTLIWTGKEWRGDNTDGVGLYRDLLHQGFHLDGQRLAILGAGGAVQGLLPIVLEHHPSEIVIFNRTLARAEQLVSRMQSSTSTRLMAAALSEHSAALTRPFDGIIQATSSALLSDAGLLFPPLLTHANTWCYDLAYGTAAEMSQQWAHQRRLRFADGLGMLVEQAAESFWLWRNVRPETRSTLAELRQLIEAPYAPSHV